MNKVILMGRLTRDIELRQTPNGLSVTRFSIAVNRRFASKGAQQTADFIDCVAWRQTADFIGKYFHKGDMIAVVGSITTDNYTDRNGQKVYRTYVTVDEVYFTGAKQSRQESADGGYDFTEIDDGDVPPF
jgi:single-strand DNA-binding protein